VADYRPLVLSGTAAASVITELPASSILITDGARVGASSLSISGHLELLGGISGTPSISATTITADTFIGPAFNAAAASVSATAVSGVLFNGMPYPPPFVYVEMDAAGTDSTNEQDFALGAATTVTTGDSSYIAWNDAEKYFTVSATGTYEIIGNFAFDSGSQSDPLEITSKKNGVDVHIISPKQYGATGPNENSFHSVLTAVAGDYITVTLHMDDGGSKTGHLESGSNLMLRRIK